LFETPGLVEGGGGVRDDMKFVEGDARLGQAVGDPFDEGRGTAVRQRAIALVPPSPKKRSQWGARTPIAWCDHTLNPWLGCLRVSPACIIAILRPSPGARPARSPRARAPDPQAERIRTSPAYWREPFRWNAKAAAAGARRRVFCASMADIFDNHASAAWRTDLWSLIRATPALDWLI
jgi:hypothetical protein